MYSRMESTMKEQRGIYIYTVADRGVSLIYGSVLQVVREERCFLYKTDLIRFRTNTPRSGGRRVV